MNYLRILLSVAVIVAAFTCTNCTNIKKDSDASFQLKLQAPIDKWDEAIPLGNGLTGGLLWGHGKEIRLSLDRGDLWDTRTHPGFSAPGFTYETVTKLALSGKADSLNKQFSRVSDYPTKLPGCRVVITLAGEDTLRFFHLDMKEGLGSAGFGDKVAQCFFSPARPVAFMNIPGNIAGVQLLPNNAVEKLGNPVPVTGNEKEAAWLLQEAALGFRYAFVVVWKQAGGHTLLSVSTATSKETDDPLKQARKQADQALKTGFVKLFSEHKAWWDQFWEKSSVTIPDSTLMQHYNLVQYYYGAASRTGAPPMPLQGVWTADEGKLPPWHGDYHHDLNTQLTYWAYLHSNRPDQGLSFLDFMWSLKPVHEKFAHDFYGTKGMVVPGVMALDGKPMGAWFQYSLSPTMGAWIAQSFYWHWRYTMDPLFLKERAYPYCAGIAEALAGLMKPDAFGKLKLSLSSSPEIHNNTQKAWLTPNSNFDLSLIRWIFEANAEMAKALNMEKEAIRWQELLAQMDNLAVEGDFGPLLVSPDEPLKESHRHFSHLMAIHPLGILNIEGTDSDRRIIESSLEQIDQFGSKYWCGYSFSWMSCMRARAGQPEKALENLVNYLDCTTRNGFHVNGPQTRSELSDYKMHAFTLEGNFAALQAIHEMLLQSWGGLIRIFPAMPGGWKEASFRQLRTEGGFLVDAERKEGKTTRVTITATADQPLQLKNPFLPAEFISDIKMEEQKVGIFACYLKKGQTVHLNVKKKQ